MSSIRMLSLAIFIVIAIDSDAPRAEVLWLITPDEAATPGAIGTRGLLGNSPLPDAGPEIRVEQPRLEQALSSPLDIAVTFIARRAPVDLSSLRLTLVKLINIDLTDRIRHYVSTEGLRVTKVNLPSGEHLVRLTLSDQSGGTTIKEVLLNVR